MKSIVLSDITTSAAAKIKKGTIDHMQDALSEMLVYFSNAIGGQNLDPGLSACYVLTGCINTGSGSNYIYSAGLIVYNNEVYYVPSATFTLGGGETVVATITTAYITGAEYDPVEFSDGSSHNIHRNRTIVLTNATAGSGDFDFLTDAVFVTPGPEQTLTAATNYTATSAACRKNRDGLVTFSGQFACGVSAAVTQTITTLPVGYRPPATYLFMVQLYQNGGSTHIHAVCTITTAGVLSIQNAGGTALNGYILFLPNIPPFYTAKIY